MTKFRVIVRGENYEIGIGTGRLFWKRFSSKMMGFYTTRFVEAESANRAIETVFNTLQRELERDGRTTAKSKLELEEIQVDEDGFNRYSPGCGYTFYQSDAPVATDEL